MRATSAGMTLVFLVLWCGLAISACGANPASSAHGANAANVMAMNAIGEATVQQVRLRASIVCGPWVVLAPPASAYSQSEITAIQQYVKAHAIFPIEYRGGSDNMVGYQASAPDPLPPTLQFAPGFPTCQADYEVTNTGNSVVQMSGVGFQPTQAPVPFTYDYKLLDICAFVSGCQTDGAAAFGCAYASSIMMTMSQSVAVGGFGDPQDASDCPRVINLQPGITVPISLTFYQPTSSEAVAFRGIPAIQIVTSAGSTILTYPTLLNNLVFADFGDHSRGDTVGVADTAIAPALPAQSTNLQVSCYALKDSTLQAVHAFDTPLSWLTLLGDRTYHQTSSLCF